MWWCRVLFGEAQWKDRNRWTQVAVKQISVICRKTFFTLGMTKQWDRLPRGAVEFPPLEILKSSGQDLKQPDTTLNWALWGEGGTRDLQRAFPIYSNLWFSNIFVRQFYCPGSWGKEQCSSFYTDWKLDLEASRLKLTSFFSFWVEELSVSWWMTAFGRENVMHFKKLKRTAKYNWINQQADSGFVFTAVFPEGFTLRFAAIQ